MTQHPTRLLSTLFIIDGRLDKLRRNDEEYLWADDPLIDLPWGTTRPGKGVELRWKSQPWIGSVIHKPSGLFCIKIRWREENKKISPANLGTRDVEAVDFNAASTASASILQFKYYREYPAKWHQRKHHISASRNDNSSLKKVPESTFIPILWDTK